MSLIVVHSDTAIKLSALGLGEDTVRRNRTFYVEATRFQFLDSWDNLLRLLIAKHTVLAGVGIQTCHTDMGLFDTKLATSIVYQFYTLDDTGFLYQVAGLSQGNMRRDMDDADILISEHHRIFLRICEGSVDFCMSIVVVTSQIQRLFVQRGSHSTIYLVSHRQFDRLFDILEGSVTTLGLHLAELECREVYTLQI